MKKRLAYIIVFILLVAVEVFIALFIDDGFIRPYLGDVIVVWVVFCFAQIFLATKFSPYAVSGGVFIFACLVEFLQGINIVKLLNLQNSRFFSVLIGTHFDVKDIVCYAAGTVFIIVLFAITGQYRRKKLDP